MKNVVAEWIVDTVDEYRFWNQVDNSRLLVYSCGTVAADSRFDDIKNVVGD